MDEEWSRSATILASSKNRYVNSKAHSTAVSVVCAVEEQVLLLTVHEGDIKCMLMCSLLQCKILPDTNAEMRVSRDEWVLANTNVSGYFRVNYDVDNWDRLLSLLNTSHQVGNTIHTDIILCTQRDLMHKNANLSRSFINIKPLNSCTALFSSVRFYLPWTELRSLMMHSIWQGNKTIQFFFFASMGNICFFHLGQTSFPLQWLWELLNTFQKKEIISPGRQLWETLTTIFSCLTVLRSMELYRLVLLDAKTAKIL